MTRRTLIAVFVVAAFAVGAAFATANLILANIGPLK